MDESKGQKLSPGDVAAALARAEQAMARGQLQAAYDTVMRLLSAVPDHAEANHLAGLLLYRAGRPDEAAERIGRAVAAAPHNTVYRSNLGVMLNAAGRQEEAVAAYRAALAQDGQLADTWSNLGVALLALERAEEAAAAQRRALELAPDNAAAAANLGRALMKLGDGAAAIAAYRQAIAQRPDYANAHLYLATALAGLGQLTEAATEAAQASVLAPDAAGAHFVLGGIRLAQGEAAAAVESYDRAVALRPDAAGFRQLGLAQLQAGALREAVLALREAISRDGDDAVSHAALGRALAGLGGVPRALESYRRALELDPGNQRYKAELAPVLVAAGLLDEATAYYRGAVAGNSLALADRGALLFTGNYLADTLPDHAVEEARAYGNMLAAAEPMRTRHANRPDPDRRLKVGLVSGDLNEHPVARFLEGVLGALDLAEIELFAYATSPVEDETTERLRQLVPQWRQAARLDDDALEAAILADGIDILIDLSGHTQHNRLPVFARKPAPVAVTWLGYSGTTGVGAIDYVLADAIVAPPAEDRLFTETVWRLPDSYLCYTPPPGLDPVTPLPALANGRVTFGSFNNLNKVNDATIALWARVLEAVPGSQLALKGGVLRRPEAVAALEARFAAVGIGAERLKMLPYASEPRDHFNAYGAVDIGLDPFPYNGTTTSCEAMAMGVPVLTLRGDRFIAHVGESLLHSVGLDGWVAADRDDYVAKAAGFAADLEALAVLRGGLRQRLFASPLCDAPRFARHFEAALRQMWQAWCARQAMGAAGGGKADD